MIVVLVIRAARASFEIAFSRFCADARLNYCSYSLKIKNEFILPFYFFLTVFILQFHTQIYLLISVYAIWLNYFFNRTRRHARTPTRTHEDLHTSLRAKPLLSNEIITFTRFLGRNVKGFISTVDLVSFRKACILLEECGIAVHITWSRKC